MAQLLESSQDKAVYAGFKRTMMQVDKGENMVRRLSVSALTIRTN